MNGNLLTFNGRLPGVLCETSVSSPAENQLRLDVAGFVGLAERGPLDLPVMVEDISQFRLIFGQALPVAIDQGLPCYAHLASAVEAFFEHGGQRCYVVRVAGADHRPNRFILPGLLQPDSTGQWQPVAVNAAWPGRWSDFVGVSTSLQSLPLKIRDDHQAVTISGTAIENGTFTLPLRTSANRSVTAGDLLRLQIQQGDEASLAIYVVYMQVDQAEIEPTLVPSLVGTPIRVSPNPATVQVFNTMPDTNNYNAVHQLTEQGWTRLAVDLPIILETSGTAYQFTLPLETDLKATAGDLFRLEVDAQQPVTFFTVESIRRELDVDPSGQSRLVLECSQLLQEVHTLSPALWTVVQVDLLRFDLVVSEGEESMEQWLDLRFGEGERHWSTILAQEIDRHQIEPPAFPVDHFTRRSLRLGTTELTGLIYPLGISPIARRFGPQLDVQATDKDGLNSYDPVTLFTDEAFRTVTTRNVMTVANDLLYTGPAPRRLKGLHGLLPVDEVAMIALPDLAHRGWEPLLMPPFTLPEEEPPVEELPRGFHNCVLVGEILEAEECPSMAVLMLGDSTLVTEPNIQATLENLPNAIAPAAYDEGPLLAVQRILIRLCAAQSDRLAILNLPRHYQGRLVEQWQQRLITTPDFLDGSPLSYAACYHGWVGIRETTTPSLAPLRYTPPDGAACGLIADREIARGAWIAPANQPLRTVSDLAPNFSNPEWFALYNLQLNIVRQLPGRYAFMSALTLSREYLLTQISVRRLLIFLRKLALLEGQRYLFETNNERFRASVQTYFERVLDQLLERGGIQAYQVVTGAEVNTMKDFDNGRFVIALKIAPTSPIEFITVILLRSGDDGIDILEL